MVNYNVYEPKTAQEELINNPNINIGDTISFISDNQQGYKKFIVVDDNGNKKLNLVDSYDMQQERALNDDSDIDTESSEYGSNKRSRDDETTDEYDIKV